MRFYRHIAEEHVTRLMWCEAGMDGEPSWPLRPIDLGQWVVLGPFRDPAVKLPLLHEFVDEAKVAPAKGARAGGKKWEPVALTGRMVPIDSALGTTAKGVAYLATRVRVPTKRAARLSLGSDDGVRVWVNAKLVHTHAEDRALTMDEDQVAIELETGWNSLLFKVQNSGGGWCLQARLLDEKGEAMRDAEDALP